MESQYSPVLLFVALTVLISFFWILIQGFNNELVIYKDKGDFLRVILTLIAGFILASLLNRTPGEDTQMDNALPWILTPVMGVVTFILVMDNFILCVRNNNHRVFVGILIAIYRYFYILLALLLLIRIIDGGSNRRRTSGEVVLGLIGTAAVGYGIFRLINGDRVEKLRNNSVND